MIRYRILLSINFRNKYHVLHLLFSLLIGYTILVTTWIYFRKEWLIIHRHLKSQRASQRLSFNRFKMMVFITVKINNRRCYFILLYTLSHSFFFLHFQKRFNIWMYKYVIIFPLTWFWNRTFSWRIRWYEIEVLSSLIKHLCLFHQFLVKNSHIRSGIRVYRRRRRRSRF